MKTPVKIIKRDSSLQRNYKLHMETGIILSLSLLIIVFNINFTASSEDDGIQVSMQEEIYIEEIIQTKQEIKVPPPPKPVVPIEVPNDEVIEDEIIEINAELDLDEELYYDPPPKPLQQEDEYEDEIFIVVEKQPILKGGIAAVQELIVYPKMALQAGIEGRVIVQFVIDKQGNVVNPVVIRGIGGGCDEEALRAVKQARFSPGMQRGKPVSVRYTLPITFRLKSDRNSK